MRTKTASMSQRRTFKVLEVSSPSQLKEAQPVAYTPVALHALKEVIVISQASTSRRPQDRHRMSAMLQQMIFTGLLSVEHSQYSQPTNLPKPSSCKGYKVNSMS